MTRFSVLLLFCLVAPMASAQVNCDSACVFPNQAPAECFCTVIGVNASSNINNPDPEAKAVIDRMRDAYAEAVANVDDYTVVETTSAGGLPVVLYYEKEVHDGFPGFRLVSPTELADREAQAEGQMNPREIAGALASLVRSVGGNGNADADAAEANAQGASAQSADDSAQSADGSSDGQSNGGGLGALLDQLAGDLEDIATGADVRESREDLADRLFTDKFFYERARHNGTVPISIDGQLIDCNELYADDRDFEPGELGEILGDGYERFDIFYMRAWVPKEGPALLPLAIEARIRERSVACTPEDCPHQYVTIRRTINDFDSQAGWVPRRQTSSIDGLHNLIGNLASNFQQIITNIKRLLLNAGPPTAQESAEMIREAQEQQ